MMVQRWMNCIMRIQWAVLQRKPYKYGLHIMLNSTKKTQQLVFESFRLNSGFHLSRPTPRIPLPCCLPQPSHPQLQTRTTGHSTANGPVSVRGSPRPVRRVWASSWTAVTAARPAPSKWARCAMRQTRATTTRDCTVTTARTSLGTKKECVHVSVTHQIWQCKTVFTQQETFILRMWYFSLAAILSLVGNNTGGT